MLINFICEAQGRWSQEETHPYQYYSYRIQLSQPVDRPRCSKVVETKILPVLYRLYLAMLFFLIHICLADSMYCIYAWNIITKPKIKPKFVTCQQCIGFTYMLSRHLCTSDSFRIRQNYGTFVMCLNFEYGMFLLPDSVYLLCGLFFHLQAFIVVSRSKCNNWF